MQLRGAFRGIQREWQTNTPLITLAVTEGNLEELNNYQDADLNIEIKKFRYRRSLDSNAYAWVLMQKIAEKHPPLTKDDVYLEMLKKYSSSFTHIVVKENAIPKLAETYRTFVDLGEISVCGTKGHQLQVFFGSSTFDSKEMSTFIEGLISECKELGIETLPPQEIERMNQAWAKG